MRFENYKLRVSYKLNKLKGGKFKDKYIYFSGFEIPGYNDPEDPNSDPAKRKIYQGDIVIYKNPNKPNHPNNGLKAVVSKVHKPLKDKEKIEEWKRNRRGTYPLKIKKYDLRFELDEDEKYERRFNLAEGNRRDAVKPFMEMVVREKIIALPQKKLVVSVDKSKLDKVSNSKRRRIIKKKTKALLRAVFKNGTEFKPKYVDITSKNYSTWEERQKHESLLPYAEKEVVVTKGDILTSELPSEKYEKKKYQRAKKKYKIKTIAIEEIDFSELSKKRDMFYVEDLEKEFYRKNPIDTSQHLLTKVRTYLNSLEKDNKIENSADYYKSFLQADNYFKDQGSWKDFISEYMVKKVVEREGLFPKVEDPEKETKSPGLCDCKKNPLPLKLTEDRWTASKRFGEMYWGCAKGTRGRKCGKRIYTSKKKSKIVNDWLEKLKSKDTFDFITKEFMNRPIIEQLFIIREILKVEGSKGKFSELIESSKEKGSEDVINIDTDELYKFIEYSKRVAIKYFSDGSLPRIEVKIKIYLQAEDDLSAKIGFGTGCEKVFDDLGTTFKKMFGLNRSKKKKKKKKEKKTRKKEDFILIDEEKMDATKGGKRRKRRTRRKRKKKRKNRTLKWKRRRRRRRRRN